MRRNRIVFRIFAVMLVVMTCFASSLPVYAAEQLENSFSKKMENALSDSALDNSTKGEWDNNPPVFPVAVVEDGEVAGIVHCFYVVDELGNAYLLSSLMTAASAESGCELYIFIDGELEKAEYLGYDENYFFAYMDHRKLEKYEPIEIGDDFSIDDSLILVAEEIEEGKVSYAEAGIPSENLEEYDENYSIGIAVDEETMFLLGAPIIDERSEQVVGYMEASLETEEFICQNLTLAELEDSYSVGFLEEYVVREEPIHEESENTETSKQPQTEEKPIEEAPVEEAPTEKPAAEEEPQSRESSSLPGFAYVIFGVLIGGAFYAKGKKKKDKKDKNQTVSKESSGEMSDWQEGTIPLGTDSIKTSMEENYGNEVPQAIWQLRGMSGSFTGQVFALYDVLRFGRNSQNQIAFPENTKGVSTNHCEVSMENGRIQLRDLGSTYGTYLGNGQKLNERISYELKEGDVFWLATKDQSFRVEKLGERRQEFTPVVKAVGAPKVGAYYHANAEGQILFGRSFQCQVCFDKEETGISTNHCILYRDETGMYLMDTGSTNGTFLSENQRLRPNVPYRVEKGTSFYLTSKNYLFVITED